jgi:hypothetical protein
MTKKPYIQPQLIDRGRLDARTLETNEPNDLEIDFVTKTRGSAL